MSLDNVFTDGTVVWYFFSSVIGKTEMYEVYYSVLSAVEMEFIKIATGLLFFLSVSYDDLLMCL